MAAWPTTDPERRLYWELIRAKADLLGSDGCSKVPDFYLDACLEHDLHYRTGRKQVLRHTWEDGVEMYRLENGEPISFRWANARFRSVIQDRSVVRKVRLPGWLSPMSWWRWAGVTIGGRAAWDRYRQSR